MILPANSPTPGTPQYVESTIGNPIWSLKKPIPGPRAPAYAQTSRQLYDVFGRVFRISVRVKF
ncbi:MAG: hypothetical protein QM688_04160 [Sphingomonas bacterium]